MNFRNKIFTAGIAAALTLGSFLYASAAPNTVFQVNLLPQANNTYDLGSTTPALQWKNVFTKGITISDLSGSGTRCVQVSNAGVLSVATGACGSGGGGGGAGTWATTTSTHAGRNINYPLEATDIVTIGDSATTSAEWWYDPNTNTGSLTGTQTIGTLNLTNKLTVPNGGTGATTFTSSQLLYGNGTSALTGVATTTLTASSPLSLSQPVVKVGGSNSVLTIDTSGAWTGNAGTATALAGNGANCSAGNAPLGVDASGASESCFDVWTEAENTSAAYAAQATTLTVAGTANQITSSAGAQSLAANRTWTLSFPSHIVQNSALFTLASTTNATSTNQAITNLLTFGGVTGSTWASFCTAITGSAALCDGDDATGAGGSSAYEIATTSDIGVPQVAYFTKTGGRTTLGSVATTSVTCSGSVSCTGFNVFGSSPITITGTGGGGSGTVSTSTNETAGSLAYWTSTSATPALLGKVATTTLTLSGFPANVPSTYGKLVGGADTTWTWWGLATTSQPSTSNVLYSTGGQGVAGVATSSQTLSNSFSTTGSLGAFLGGTSGTLYGIQYFTFTVGTTTTWTGTTTIPLGPAYVGETWNGMQCFTNAGSVNIDVYYDTTHMATMVASTTVGTFTWTTNNTPTAASKRKVDIGTPASSPSYVSCTVKKTI